MYNPGQSSFANEPNGTRAMIAFLIRRTALGVITVISISIISFVIIQLPEGDFATGYVEQLMEGDLMSAPGAFARMEDQLRSEYGLDRPMPVQYLKWVGNMVQGKFGQSLEYRQPVSVVLGERMLMTVVLALAVVLFTWVLAVPIGIYSAVRQHSVGDYVFTFIGFMGVATPDFLLALVLLYASFVYFDFDIGGLFSAEYVGAPWSVGRVIDLLKHLWIPALVLGTSGTAALIRIMRANLLDELARPYVVTARAKGVSEWKLVLKYPVRVALNPLISTVGYVLPYLISGSIIVSVVLSLYTVGPLLLRALLVEDMFLAGTIVLFLGVFTVIGTLLSDLLLVIVDPRIKMESN